MAYQDWVVDVGAIASCCGCKSTYHERQTHHDAFLNDIFYHLLVQTYAVEMLKDLELSLWLSLPLDQVVEVSYK